MPNRIINTIRLTGDREKINELLESVKDNRFGIGSLDFNVSALLLLQKRLLRESTRKKNLSVTAS